MKTHALDHPHPCPKWGHPIAKGGAPKGQEPPLGSGFQQQEGGKGGRGVVERGYSERN